MNRLVQLFLFIVFCCSNALANPSSDDQDSKVHLYTYEFNIDNFEPAISERTFQAIQSAIAPRDLVITTTSSLEELEDAINNKNADIVIAGAAIYRRHLENGMRDLATLVTPQQPNPDQAVGALLVVRKNSPVNEIKDLANKRIAVTSLTEFRDSLVLEKEFYDAGLHFRPVPFGRNPRDRLSALKAGKADAAAVPVCWLEEESEGGESLFSEFKPIGLKKTDEVHCLTSTALYPNWSILASYRLKGKDIAAIAETLHRMPMHEDGEYWTIASDFRSVDTVYKTLKKGPYAYLNEWTLRRIWAEYKIFVLLGILSIIFGLWHLCRTQKLVDIRTAQLVEALEEQKRLSAKANQLTIQYEAARRAFTVAQLSSIVAHELSQPLSGILLYIRGLKVLMLREARKHDFDASPFTEAADKAFKLAKKADSIVRSVRSFARSESAVTDEINLSDLIRKVSKTINELQGNRQIKFIIDLEHNIYVIGSSIEIEVAVMNWLKNSIDATRSVKFPSIRIQQMQSAAPGYVQIAVTDNGPPVQKERIESVMKNLHSIKPEGLGLGLSITSTILERHCGRLVVKVNDIGHFSAIMILPIVKTDSRAHSA